MEPEKTMPKPVTVVSDLDRELGLPPLEQAMLDRLKVAHSIGSTNGRESAALNRLVHKGFAERIPGNYGCSWKLA